MLAVTMPREIESRLSQVAVRIGIAPESIVLDAVLARLDDLEDLGGAEAALASGGATTPLEELEKELGMAG